MTLIKSMTGYGRAVETVNGREFTVELRSVNNRYLDCSVKLPRSLSFAEGSYPTPWGTVTVRHTKNADGTVSSDIEAPDEIEIVMA